MEGHSHRRIIQNCDHVQDLDCQHSTVWSLTAQIFESWLLTVWLLIPSVNLASCECKLQYGTWLQRLGHTGVTPTCSETRSELIQKSHEVRLSLEVSRDTVWMWVEVDLPYSLYNLWNVLEHKILICSNSWRNEWIFEIKTTRTGKIYFFLL